MSFIYKFLIIIFIKLSVVTCARILGIFPVPAHSHNILAVNLMMGLADAGHDVTMVSPFRTQHTPSNGSYEDIVLTGEREKFKDHLKKKNLFEEKDQNGFAQTWEKYTIIDKMMSPLLEHKNMLSLLNSNRKFDVVILEYFLNDAFKAIAYRFSCPLILFSTTGSPSWINPMVGNVNQVSYVPYLLTSYSANMTLNERLCNAAYYLYDFFIKTCFFLPRQNKILKKIFPESPDIFDLYNNVSLVLLNSHSSLNQASPYAPNMVDIAGFHIKPPKTLPEDINQVLDKAKFGAIYFSLGSNAQSKSMPLEKRNALLSVFRKINMTVLWKWEEVNLPGKPDNVFIKKWMPQNDVLAHKNVKLFITHGGQLSTTETIYHGKPTLTIPIFGDQYLNAKQAEINGYARVLPFHSDDFSENTLMVLLKELLENPTYTKIAEKTSKLFHDRPMTAMETAVYWVEYVIRNGACDHLKVAGIRLPWYILYSVDVGLVLSFFIIITLSFLYMSFKIFRNFFCKIKIKNE